VSTASPQTTDRHYNKDGAAHKIARLKKRDGYLSLSEEERTTVRLMVRTWDAMDGDGMSPSYATIARKRKLGRRQVIRHLKAIENAKVFSRVNDGLRHRPNGSNTSNLWRVNLPAEEGERVTSPLVTSALTSVTTHVTRDVTTRSSLEQLKPSLEGSRSALQSAGREQQVSPLEGGSTSEDDASAIASYAFERSTVISVGSDRPPAGERVHMTDAELNAWLEKKSRYERAARAALGQRRAHDEAVRLPWLSRTSRTLTTDAVAPGARAA
jgi:hypothetical protein